MQLSILEEVPIFRNSSHFRVESEGYVFTQDDFLLSPLSPRARGKMRKSRAGELVGSNLSLTVVKEGQHSRAQPSMFSLYPFLHVSSSNQNISKFPRFFLKNLYLIHWTKVEVIMVKLWTKLQVQISSHCQNFLSSGCAFYWRIIYFIINLWF